MGKTPTEWMIEPLRRYAQFTGRARRAEYWWFILFGAILALIAYIVDSLLGLHSARGGTGVVGGLVSLALFVPQLAVSVRRLHDIDRSGWWAGGLLIVAVPFGFLGGMAAVSGSIVVGAIMALLALAVLIYSIVLLVWFCQRGTAGPNRFGPDPLVLDESGAALI